jgi:hypothetical protein
LKKNVTKYKTKYKLKKRRNENWHITAGGDETIISSMHAPIRQPQTGSNI